jgi:hypothetical protein
MLNIPPGVILAVFQQDHPMRAQNWKEQRLSDHQEESVVTSPGGGFLRPSKTQTNTVFTCPTCRKKRPGGLDHGDLYQCDCGTLFETYGNLLNVCEDPLEAIGSQMNPSTEWLDGFMAAALGHTDLDAPFSSIQQPVSHERWTDGYQEYFRLDRTARLSALRVMLGQTPRLFDRRNSINVRQISRELYHRAVKNIKATTRAAQADQTGGEG